MVIEAERPGWSIGIEDQCAAYAAGNRISQSGANAWNRTELNGARAEVRLLVIERHPAQKWCSAARDGYRRRGCRDKTDIRLREDVAIVVAQIESPFSLRSYCSRKGVAAIVLQ